MQIDTSAIILETNPFSVEKLSFRKDEQKSFEYFRLLSRDWAIVLPVTSKKQAILVRQFRVGTLQSELEVPGGCVDDSEKKDPTLAAARELEEETGFVSMRFLSLLSVSPNPALLNNRVHMFLALDCEETRARKHYPDESEAITLERYDVSELDGLVRFGRINHALSALCIQLALKYLS